MALALPATAITQSTVLIKSVERSSHLRLSVAEGNLVVQGQLEHGATKGCRFRGGRAVCPLAGVGRIEVITSPQPDKVEVLDPLPVPLTAYLGGGSDKFIGNSEPDTCFPQGAKRNRCVGGGGNDVCIAGPKNTDCVGGPGNDYCRGGAGSDGCWGGPGNDVCVMGPGNDGCHGGPGNDRLYGGPGHDKLYGGPGRDYCNGGPGRGKSYGCEEGPGH